jgi:hypothetical protein
MKQILIIIPLVFLSACATKKALVQMPLSVPGATLSADNLESVRYGENVKAYPVGRYVDPNNQLVMHESHTVYRVETTAKWNLHPNTPVRVATGPVVQIIDPAHKDPPITPEIVAEINRQKKATRTLIEQGSRMNQALTQLSQSVSTEKKTAEENVQLRNEVSTAEQRIEALENQFRKQQSETFTSPQLPTKGTNNW